MLNPASFNHVSGQALCIYDVELVLYAHLVVMVHYEFLAMGCNELLMLADYL
jgi:hypothetical protein